jgi:hypothetical protein
MFAAVSPPPMSSEIPSPPLPFAQRAGLWATLAVAICVVVMAGHVIRTGGGLSSLAAFGDSLPRPLYTDARVPPGTAVQRDSDGYDGQFYYMMALSPFAPDARIPEARSQRLLYPLLAWVIAFGRPEVTTLALALVNLLSVGLTTALLAVWLRRRGFHPAWSFLGGASAGAVLSAEYLCPDAMLVTLLAASLFAMDRRWYGLASLALAGAILTKEPALAAWLAVAIAVAVTRPRPRAYLVFLAPLPWLVWAAVLNRNTDALIVTWNIRHAVGQPLNSWLGAVLFDSAQAQGFSRAIGPFLLAVTLAVTLWLALQARGGPQQLIAGAALIWGAAALCWNDAIWQPLVAAARNMAPLALFGAILAAAPFRRGRYAFAALALLLLALVVARALFLGQVPEIFFTEPPR